MTTKGEGCRRMSPPTKARGPLREGALALLGLLLVLLPLAAAVTAIEVAPPLTISSEIVGADVTSKVELGNDVHTVSVLGTTFTLRSRMDIGPIPVGTRVRFTYTEPVLTDPAGALDTQRINTIIQDLSHPETIEAQIANETRWYYTLAAAIAAEIVLIAEAAILGLLKLRRRRLELQPPEIQSALRADRLLPRRLGYTTGAVAAAVLLIVPASNLRAGATHTSISPDPLLAQIGIDGVGVKGPVDDLRKILEPSVASYLQRVDTFYRAQADGFALAFQARYGATPLEKDDGTKRIVFADDFQGQEGPARIVGNAARAYNADLIVVGGDTTTTGNSLETFELSSLHEHAGDIPAFINRGKHDPPEDQLRGMVKSFKNYQIADDQVHTIAGIRILGINAPTQLTASGETEVIEPNLRGFTPVQATIAKTQQVIAKACSSDKKLVVTMHDQLIGTPLAQQACSSVPLVLAGREYTTQPTMRFGPTTEFVSGSTGGHTADGGIEVFSEIHSPATFQVITIDAKTQEFLHADLITLAAAPSTSVTIEPIIPLDEAESAAAAQRLIANLASSD